MVGTGRTTTIKQLLEKLEKGDPPPDDLLYVNNFKTPDEPTLLTLPAGKGRPFAAAMDSLIEMLQRQHPRPPQEQILRRKAGRHHRRASSAKQKEILQAFEEEAAKDGFSVIQVQMGMFVKPDLIPVIDGPARAVRQARGPGPGEEVPGQSPLETLKSKYEELSAKLEGIFEKLREIDEETRTLLKAWDAESIAPMIKGAVAEIGTPRFPDPKVAEYLADVEATLIGNIELFKNQKKDEEKGESGRPLPRVPGQPPRGQRRPQARPGRDGDQPHLHQPLRLDRIDGQPVRRHPDRFHQDQGRVVPQGQRRVPGHQRPRRPDRAGRLGDAQAHPAQPDLRDPELTPPCSCSPRPGSSPSRSRSTSRS